MRWMTISILLVAGCSSAHLECQDLAAAAGFGCGGAELRHCVAYPSDGAQPEWAFLAVATGDQVHRHWDCATWTCTDMIEEATCVCFDREGQGDFCDHLDDGQ